MIAMLHRLSKTFFSSAGSILIFLLLSFSLPSATVSAKQTSSQLNPIQIENQLPGTTAWRLTDPDTYDPKTYHYPHIEGYAWTTSASVGDVVSFSVNTTAPSFRADVYRMGWYQGTGGRFIESISNIAGHRYTFPAPDLSTGLVEPDWPLAFTLTIGANWTTGMYMIKLTASTGKQCYIPLIVRSDRPSDFAFIHTVNTDEAYNYWGGTSFYVDETKALRWTRAFEISFDRPFQQDTGAGQFFWWEYPMVRWLEKNGYDVSYLSDLDIQNMPYPLQNYHALLIAGHSEYWSQQMRDHLEGAVNSGTNLAVFAANDIYWHILYEPRTSSTNPLPERIMVCYKDSTIDPFYGHENSQVTDRYRDPPLNEPEQSFLGGMFSSFFDNSLPGFAWVVADPSSWVFAGTGLKKGDKLPGLVGYEYDKVFSTFPKPAGLAVLSASPVVNVDKMHEISNSTLYTAASGARVFNAGTIRWSWGLDDSSSAETGPGLVNKAAQRITANILDNFRVAGKPSPPTSASTRTSTLLFYALLVLILLGLLFLFYRVIRGNAQKRLSEKPLEATQSQAAQDQTPDQLDDTIHDQTPDQLDGTIQELEQIQEDAETRGS